jgi:hypothetical protein
MTANNGPGKPARMPRWRHVPLPALILGAGVWLGYYSHDHLVTGFEVIALGPFILGFLLFLFACSALLLAWKSPEGRRAYAVMLHIAVVVMAGLGAWYVAPSIGRRLWEQWVLGPRRQALVNFSKNPPAQGGGPVEIAGYPFERYETTAQGAMFYVYLAGGPWKSQGVFVPYSKAYQGFEWPLQGGPAEAQSVVPTSVNGLYWFITLR